VVFAKNVLLISVIVFFVIEIIDAITNFILWHQEKRLEKLGVEVKKDPTDGIRRRMFNIEAILVLILFAILINH